MADPYRRQADVLPRLLRAASRPARASSTSTTGRTERDRAHPDDARQRPRGGRRGLRRATSPPPSGIKQVMTGDTLAAPDAPIAARAHHLPRARHQGRRRAQDEGRPGEDVDRARPPRRRGPDVPGAAPTRRPARPRSPGMGELHLEVLVDRMKREFKRRGERRAPAGLLPRDRARHAPRRSRAGSCARPAARASSASSTSTSSPRPARASTSSTRSRAARSPSEFIPAVEKGVEEALENGVKAGYPMVDVRVTLVDGKYHDVDSSEIAFKVAGSLALKEAARTRPARAARADLLRRGRHPRGVPGRRRSATSRRRRGPRRRSGAARQRAGRDRRAAAQRDVRLRDRPALEHAGTRDLHDAVRGLRGGARRASPRRSSSSAPASRSPA